MYYYNITLLREIDETTDTEIQRTIFHKRGDLTDTGVMRILLREGVRDATDRLCRVECGVYSS